MSAVHEPEELDGPHEGPIKTPKQLILTVLFSFLVPIFGIILLVMFVTTDKRPAAGSTAMTPQAVAERIRPVGVVEIRDASDLSSLKTGEQVVAAQCGACHAGGALGAPKIGDVAAWGPRIKTGFDALLHSALAGKGQMPPQGGGDFSDYEIARAVVYMTSKAGGTFPEPAPPVTAAGGNAATTTTAATAGAAPAATTTAATMTAGMPSADANAGRPEATPTAALNAQVREATPNAVPSPGAAPAAGTMTAAATANAATTSGPPALFNQVCSACHATGVAGAPKVGDKAAWAPRAAQGVDALTASAIKGKGAMPPKGGSSASDADIRAVVSYMVNASK
ncbi:MAG: cytochrome c5 family protein [Rhizobacter sp.]|nr:cytochrome c5 family protein [Rhizobacter sp.]